MLLWRLVKCRVDYLTLDRPLHVSNFLWSLIDEEYHKHYLRRVGGDGIGYLLQKDGLSCLGRSHDKGSLSFSHGSNEINQSSTDISRRVL